MQYVLIFHCYNGYANAPQCYVIGTPAVLLALELHCTCDVFGSWCTFSLVWSVLHAQNQGTVRHLLQLNPF